MTELLDHQAAHLEAHWQAPYQALFWEMGTGKTLACLRQAEQLYLNDRITTLLVVAPNGLHLEWLDQAEEHLDTDYWGFAWSSYARKKQLAGRVLALKPCPTLKIITLNIEALSSQKGKATVFVATLLKQEQGKVLWVVDESYTIKSPKSTRTKVCLKLAKFAHYRCILSGAPLLESPFDVWAQAEFLEPGLLGHNYWKFTRRYAEWEHVFFGHRNFKRVKEFTNLDELRDRLTEFASFIMKKDCLDLPKKLYRKVPVELTPAQTKAYKEMKELLTAFVEDDQEVMASNPMDKLHKLHSIVLGYLRDGEGQVTELPHNRLTILLNVLDEVGGGKVLIWCNHVVALEYLTTQLKEAYGEKTVAAYYGATSMEERQRLKKDFQTDPRLRILVLNQDVGGRGLNLTAATTVVYYANSYKLERRVQSEDRCHRMGQTKHVTYIDLVAKGTVDEKVITALRNKVDLANEVLKGHLRLEQLF